MLMLSLLLAETEIQSADADYLGPIAVAYCVACAIWILSKRLAGERFPDEPVAITDKRWIELISVLLVAIGVFAIGGLYRADLLLPDASSRLAAITTAVNLSLPYAPIFLCLLLRQQGTESIWVTRQALPWKLGTGMLAAVGGLLVFQLLRGDIVSTGQVLQKSISVHALSHFPAVFLEAVAVAFVFVRLRWVVGTFWAIAIPSLLFALGHVPSGIESERSVAELATFFVFNSCIAAAIFAVVARSRDVIWIAIPHYILDVASGLFG